MNFINAERHRFGVEPICRVLEIAPSSYYAAVSRPASARQVRDQELKQEIERVHRDNFGVSGARRCGGSCTGSMCRWGVTEWAG